MSPSGYEPAPIPSIGMASSPASGFGCAGPGGRSMSCRPASTGSSAGSPSAPPGAVSADEARAKALETLALAKKGIDPRDAEAKRETGPTVAELGRRFLEEYVPDHCKASTQQEYRRSVRLFIDPVIGEMQVSEVQRKDIAALHHGLRDKPYQANRTLGVLSKMFSMSEIWGWRQDGSNPCRHVKRYKEHQRD